MERCFQRLARIVSVVLLVGMGGWAAAQTPVALPYTMTTIAGGLVPAASYASGKTCPGLTTTMTTAYGDGCPAVSAKFGAGGRGGVAVDQYGTVFVADDISSVIHAIDANTGIMSLLAGSGSACTAAYDKWGDNCLAAKNTTFNGPRGIGLDPYGNVLIAGYNDYLIHVVCRAASPLCSASQIGYMEAVAGCVAATSSTGTATTGKGVDNEPGLEMGVSTCSSTLYGAVDAARGVTGDVYGNVYFADTASGRYRVVLGPYTSSYFSGNNPLYAAVQTAYSLSSLPTAGYVYTLAGLTTTATSAGTSCSGSALDTVGDGCVPAYTSVVASTGVVTGVAVDAAGNMVFTDSTNGLRVFFANASGTAGTLMSAAIQKAEGMGSAPTIGHVYRLGGAGSTAATATPALASTVKFADGNNNKLTISPQGNIYIADGGNVYFYDIYNATMRLLLANGTAPAFKAQCGSTGAYARSAYGDGCPVTGSTSYAAFGGGSSGLGIAVDGQGNLYMYDSVGYSSGMLVRKVLAQGTGVQSTTTLAALASSNSGAYPLNSLGVAQPQTYQVHFPADSAGTASLTFSPNSNFSLATPNCTEHSVDGSTDCTMVSTFTPTVAGMQSGTFTLTAGSGEIFTGNLGGTASGSALAIDNVTLGGTGAQNTVSLLSGSTPTAIAVDAVGNLYEASGSSILGYLPSLSTPAQTLVSGLSAAPTTLAVDQAGDIYYLNGTQYVMELAATAVGTSTTAAANSYPASSPTEISYTPSNLGTAEPEAIATDASGNVYVADLQGSYSTIYKLSPTALNAAGQATCSYGATASTKVLPSLCQTTIYNSNAFGVVNAMTMDAAGNLYVNDSGNKYLYKLTPTVSNGVYTYTETTLLSGQSVDALATDAGGDLYVQSGATVTMYPVSGPTTAGVSILAGITTPVGVAVDGAGNVYSADASAAAVSEAVRGAYTENFNSSYSTEFTGTLTNVGNQLSAAQSSTTTEMQSISGTPTSEAENVGAFSLAGGSSSACSFSSNLLASMSAGQSCTMTATFPAIGSGEMFDYIAFAPTSPATSALGQLTLEGLADLKGYATVSSFTNPCSATTDCYYSTGTEGTIPVTVFIPSTSTDGTTTLSSAPTTANYVNVSIDAGTATSYSFAAVASVSNGYNGTVSIPVSALAAGTHSITVSFPQQNSLLSSSATNSSFIVTPVTPTISWTPSSYTQQVSAPLGTGVLDASISPSILGNFAYAYGAAASCTSTTAASGSTPIDASTYLPLNTTGYTLYATFCPADTTDYESISMTLGTAYTVTQASTTASIGASTMVLAPSGGNYTSLTTALQALPSTGGTIYIAPGIYSGQNVISYPNVSLRGLGGDPTKVILTGENGDFSTGSIPPGYSLGPAGKGSDEGSATLDITKNTYQGQQSLTATYTPNNFYAEYLTVQNTYDTDPVTTSTETASSNGGTCSSGTTARTLQYLYNNNLECGAQAMAIYMNADQAVLNNVNLISQQDTLYAGTQGCGTYCTAARAYMWQGLIVGNVDYIFGDAAMVMDHTNIFTTWHGLTATGQDTITAQNKRFASSATSYSTGGADTSSSSIASTTFDYLSGFVCNACKLMSQSTGMTSLYYGRPWDISTSSYASSYSTFVLLNSAVDQVNGAGWVDWTTSTSYLSTSTYGEFNTSAYTDPTPGTAPYPYALFNYDTSLPSLLYTGDESELSATNGAAAYYYQSPTAAYDLAGGNTGSGATSLSSRESSAHKYNAGTASPWYPVAFLSTTVPSTKLSSGDSASWNPVSALTSHVNNFVPTSSVGSITNGSSVTILGRPTTPGAGVIPTGTYAFYDSIGTNQTCTAASSSCTLISPSGAILDASGEAYLTTSALAVGKHYLTMVYGGDSNFTGSTSSVYTVEVLASGQTASAATLSVANTSSTSGKAITGTVTVAPAAAPGTVTLYLDGVSNTTCTLSSGTCSWSISAPTVGSHTIYAYYPGNSSYGDATTSSTTIEVVAAVASGDTRTVSEPSFPSVCQQLTAALTTDVSTQDLDASVDATTSNIDGARIQTALNACSGTGQAVELSMDSSSAHNAFLSGPLSMPSNVTLLVDPGVTLYFSRNVQDYDYTAGTHTCGTINGNSATSSCLPLIGIPKTSTNVGIMGYGKLNGRGNDALLNAFSTSGYTMPGSPTWWSISAQANGEGNQQNPRFIQMNSGTSNVTLYKISLLNSPMFHVSTTGAVSGFTAWDIKIVTPTYARNTDGIDPGSVTNATITKSWISDGDDNIAVGASSTASANISITNNHFYAGHGSSIGSYTNGGVSNILFDGNVSMGDAWSGYGSAISAANTVNGTAYAANYADGNSTGIHIKSANDRGGLLTGIQYSNSCFYDHKTDIQITPYYSSGDSTTEFPEFSQILFQNLLFATDSTNGGTVELTGEYNTNNSTPVSYPLGLTLDNVSFPSALSSLVNSTQAAESSATSTAWGTNTSGGTGQYVNLTIGPGTVSSNFLTAYNTVAATAANVDTLTSNASISTLDPPSCVITYLAPELASPNGNGQSVTYGNTATLYVIMTPTVGGATYPTGTVTLTDETTNNTYAGTFAGTSDTLAITIPASDLTIGTHTFEATSYTGDSNSSYAVPTAYQTFGSQTVTVNQAAQTITFAPATTSHSYSSGLTFGISATSTSNLAVSFASLTSSVCTVSSGTTTVLTSASALQTNATVSVLTTGTCTIAATQSGNTNYLAATPVDVNFTIGTVAPTVALALTAGSNPSIVDGSLTFTATVTSAAGSPTGKVTFLSGTTTLGSVSLSSGVAVYTTTALPTGTDSITAVYSGDTNFGSVTSSAVSQTVVAVTISTGSSSGSSSSGSGSSGSGSSSGSSDSSSTTATVAEGETATYTVSILPSAGTSFPAALTLTLSGLPTGATVTITPSSWTQTSSTVWTLASGTTISANTQVNIKLPSSSTAKSEPQGTLFGRGGAVALGFLILLPFASRMRRTGKRLRNMVLSLLLLGALAAGMTACGAGTGYYTGTPKAYTVVLTVASGTYSQSTNLTLNVE
jgi:hypothetical protein